MDRIMVRLHNLDLEIYIFINIVYNHLNIAVRISFQPRQAYILQGISLHEPSTKKNSFMLDTQTNTVKLFIER